MAEIRVFIVTRRVRADKFSERVLRDVIPPHRNSVILLVEEDFGVGDATLPNNDVTQAAKNIADVIDDADADDDSHLLIDKETRASHVKLQRRWEESGKDPSRIYVQEEQRVFQKLEKVLKELGFHWNTYAHAQLQRFVGQITPLDKWCGQFFDLKVGYLGRRLSMQLHVIGLGDHNRPFAPRRHESIGQKVLHCYFNDGDHGGSWISVQDQLSHDLPEGMVQAIQMTADAIDLPESDADEIIIYEDGLWSGSETVKRLRLIKESERLQPIRFKFAVVTDFGLMVARQAVRYFELQNVVRIDANDARLERFLGPTIPPELLYGHGMEPHAYFNALHEYIEQSAFRNPDDWPEGVETARNVVKDLGSQLVQHWYEKDRPDDYVEDGIEKFCLGGGGFASTMMFTRSIPKVCLPLFWLAGPVTLNGVSIDWKPLFLDARRIDPSLLLSD